MTLAVDNVSVRRGGRLLLDDVSLRAGRGEIVGVIGPNGAGKTTLFEAVAQRVPRETLFYLPDAIRPWADQRVGWSLRFFAGLFGMSEDRDAIAALQLEPLLRQRAGSLSKGEAKRFALALALATPQPVLLLDEPFDGLDLRQTREVAQLLRSVAATGRTLFLSIHQISDAARVCDRFVLLSEGRVCGEGTLDELAAQVPDSDRRPAGTLEDVFLALT
jgi:ABC-type multidrug transport system ATPase subunit